jgi:hypothetical protein
MPDQAQLLPGTLDLLIYGRFRSDLYTDMASCCVSLKFQDKL